MTNNKSFAKRNMKGGAGPNPPNTPAATPFYKKPIFWLAVALVAAIIILIIIIVVLTNQNKSYIDNINKTLTGQTNDFKTDLSNQMLEIKTRGGIPGPQGPAGATGLTGGSYKAAGSLKNKSNKELALDRSVGTGCNVSYLNIVNNMPSQRWILNNDNSIQNYYSENNTTGKCLTKEGNNLLLRKCTGAPNQKFIWSTQTGQIAMANDISQCIDIENRTIPRDNCYAANPDGTGQSNIRDQATDKSNLKNSPYVLYLNKCNNSAPTQVWSFSN